jgi:hypothetical protein
MKIFRKQNTRNALERYLNLECAIMKSIVLKNNMQIIFYKIERKLESIDENDPILAIKIISKKYYKHCAYLQTFLDLPDGRIHLSFMLYPFEELNMHPILKNIVEDFIADEN